MNFFNILDSLQKIDGDAIERIEHTSRRYFMNRVSQKMATLAAPAVLATVVSKAYAQTPAAIGVLQLALTLEYLEDEFYKMGNDSKTLIPSPYGPVFKQIGKHETEHVLLLESVLKDKKPAKPMFDFTLGNTLSPSTNFDHFVFLSHAFEDTGVRAYKGQAENLMDPMDKGYLQVALQIHSVEARHAAISRRILSQIRNAPNIKGWITNEEGMPEAVYKGMTSEKNVMQGPLDVTKLDGLGDIPAGALMMAATEAFDEVLTGKEASDIASLFIKK